MVSEKVRIAYEPVRREAVCLLQMMIDRVEVVRSMPDGTNLFVVGLDDGGLDRLACWGASVEDMELDADCEPDARELPKLRAMLPDLFPASRLMPPRQRLRGMRAGRRFSRPHPPRWPQRKQGAGD